MNIWHTTDWHFDHKVMIEKNYRPIDYEAQILEVIEPGDILVNHGDVTAGKDSDTKQELELVSWLKSRHIHTVLIRGNHDGRTNSHYKLGWDLVCESLVIKQYRKTWLLTHEPAEPELMKIITAELSDRVQWLYDVNVHGHLHDDGHRGTVIEDGRHILLSLEKMRYHPITLERLSQIKTSMPVWDEETQRFM